MLTYPLIHPPLIDALSRLGHGSRLLIGDGNFPYATVRSPRADVVWLNLRPGSTTVIEVLTTIQSAISIEAATVMAAEDAEPAAHDDYRTLIPGRAFEALPRGAFYDAVRTPDVGLIVATGDTRLYANLLLTVGLGGLA